VTQKGSLVDSNHLRFDFAHTAAISAEDVMAIEQLVNQQIWSNVPVTTELMDMEAAKSSGAMALFGEKYTQEVRVLSMGSFSKELCGGTHVPRTGHIGLCKITSETGIASGVRRIEARSSAAAFSWLNSGIQALDDVTNVLHASRDTVVQRVQQLQAEAKTLEKTLKKLKASLAVDQGDSLLDQVQTVGHIQVVASLVDSDANAMRQMLDQLKNKLGTSAIVLVAVEGKKARFVAGVSKDLSAQLSAVDLVNHVAMQCGGKGGGRADMAQAGAKNVPHMQNVLQSVVAWVEEQGCEA
jgi:alanyl-tRNA synthetase